VAADSDDENTDDAVMPTPSVPAMVATPSARVDTNTTVSEPSVNTCGARVHAPFASVDGYTMVPQPSVSNEQAAELPRFGKKYPTASEEDADDATDTAVRSATSIINPAIGFTMTE
jgi:hypothetical protein